MTNKVIKIQECEHSLVVYLTINHMLEPIFTLRVQATLSFVLAFVFLLVLEFDSSLAGLMFCNPATLAVTKRKR